MGYTLEQAQAQLNAYLAAETAVLAGQSYTIAGQSLTRANLLQIQDGIRIWSARVDRLQRGGIRVLNAEVAE